MKKIMISFFFLFFFKIRKFGTFLACYKVNLFYPWYIVYISM